MPDDNPMIFDHTGQPITELPPGWKPPPILHPTANVDDTCTLGHGTHVWQFATIVRHTSPTNSGRRSDRRIQIPNSAS